MTKLVDIEGVGESYAEKLKTAGVRSIEGLLKKGATPQGRQKISELSGTSDALILKWVNHADLFRIRGVAGEYAELLEAAGVDTVVELAHRNAENLHAKLVETNLARKLVRRVPTASQVANWITQAKELPRAVEY
jgi:predicted flap endonuclease-1-like 5' DNA nuclease